MNRRKRILAIALKEWRLNTRFLTVYLADNLVSPVKTTVLMYLIYAGLLVKGNASLGGLNRDNFQVYVLLGTTCHTLLMSCVFLFRTKMVMEKWWQTVTATLISPASTIEVVLGFLIGSGTINFVISGLIFTVVAFLFPVPFHALAGSILVLLMLGLFGFGIGMVGAAISLSWEGKSFFFDYGARASCNASAIDDRSSVRTL